MSVTQYPLVSVCLPTYNGERYLQEALDSLALQTYRNIELVVSDDNSKDATLTIIERFKEKVDFPVLIHKHTPAGIGANWNNCVRKSNGEFIKFLFQDDILMPSCLQSMVNVATKDNGIGLVYSKRKIIGETATERSKRWIENYSILHTKWHELQIQEGALDGRTYLRDKGFFSAPDNKIGEPSAVLIKKECFTKVGYFNTKLKQVLDTEYWSRIMKFYKLAFIDEELVGFRLHDQQATKVNAESGADDGRIMYGIYFKSIFWYLNRQCKWFLIKQLAKETVKNIVKR